MTTRTVGVGRKRWRKVTATMAAASVLALGGGLTGAAHADDDHDGHDGHDGHGGGDACEFFLDHMWANEDGIPLLGSFAHLNEYHTDPVYENLILSLASGAIGNSDMPVIDIYGGPLGWIPVFNPSHVKGHDTDYVTLLTSCGGIGLPLDTNDLTTLDLPSVEDLANLSDLIIPGLPSPEMLLDPNYLWETLDASAILSRLTPETLLNLDEYINFAGDHFDTWRLLWETALEAVTSGNPLDILEVLEITENINTLQSLAEVLGGDALANIVGEELMGDLLGETDLDSLVELDAILGETGLGAILEEGELDNILQLEGLLGDDALDGMLDLEGLGLDGLLELDGLEALLSLDNLDSLLEMEGLEGLTELDGLEGLLDLEFVEGLLDLDDLGGVDGLDGLLELEGLEGLLELDGIENLEGLLDLQGLDGLDALLGDAGLEGLLELDGLDEVLELDGLGGLLELDDVLGDAGLEGLLGGLSLEDSVLDGILGDEGALGGLLGGDDSGGLVDGIVGGDSGGLVGGLLGGGSDDGLLGGLLGGDEGGLLDGLLGGVGGDTGGDVSTEIRYNILLQGDGTDGMGQCNIEVVDGSMTVSCLYAGLDSEVTEVVLVTDEGELELTASGGTDGAASGSFELSADEVEALLDGGEISIVVSGESGQIIGGGAAACACD